MAAPTEHLGRQRNRQRGRRTCTTSSTPLQRTRTPSAAPCSGAARRAADGHPRHHRREHRHAEPREGSAAQRLADQLDDHELLAGLRQPPALRWPRRRPARTPPPVPDGPRRLHRLVPRLGARRHGGRALRGAGGPGPRRSDALPGSALDHHDLLPRPREGEGARRLGRSRRRRCGDRRSRRRPSHRVRRLADDLLRQSPRRDRTRDHSVKVIPADTEKPRWRGLDLRGAIVATTSLGAIVYAITQGSSAGWTSTQTLGFALAGLVGLAAFAVLETQHREAAAQDRAARRPRSRRRPLPDARRSRTRSSGSSISARSISRTSSARAR